MNQEMRILERWASGLVPPPAEVQIYPTNACNLRCVFCVTTTGFYRGQREVSKRRWLEVGAELCELGSKGILISGGGEPLLSSATLPLMRLFKQNGVSGRIITNGTLWDEERVRAAVEMQWDQITFSIDGPDADIHDRLRGVPGSFAKIESTLRLFRPFLENGPRLEINLVLNRVNYRSILRMVDLAAANGIAHLNLEPVCFNNPYVEHIRLGEQEREELQSELLPPALERATGYGLSTNIRALMDIRQVEKAGEMREFILNRLDEPVPGRPLRELACYEPWLWPKIEANGDVWPCSTVPLGENILERSFTSIWDGEVFREYRRRIMERDLPESCRNCVVSHLTSNSEIRKLMRGG